MEAKETTLMYTGGKGSPKACTKEEGESETSNKLRRKNLEERIGMKLQANAKRKLVEGKII